MEESKLSISIRELLNDKDGVVQSFIDKHLKDPEFSSKKRINIPERIITNAYRKDK